MIPTMIRTIAAIDRKKVLCTMLPAKPMVIALANESA
jgi:hypothetical protein